MDFCKKYAVKNCELILRVKLLSTVFVYWIFITSWFGSVNIQKTMSSNRAFCVVNDDPYLIQSEIGIKSLTYEYKNYPFFVTLLKSCQVDN